MKKIVIFAVFIALLIAICIPALAETGKTVEFGSLSLKPGEVAFVAEYDKNGKMISIGKPEIIGGKAKATVSGNDENSVRLFVLNSDSVPTQSSLSPQTSQGSGQIVKDPQGQEWSPMF